MAANIGLMFDTVMQQVAAVQRAVDLATNSSLSNMHDSVQTYEVGGAIGAPAPHALTGLTSALEKSLALRSQDAVGLNNQIAAHLEELRAAVAALTEANDQSAEDAQRLAGRLDGVETIPATFAPPPGNPVPGPTIADKN